MEGNVMRFNKMHKILSRIELRWFRKNKTIKFNDPFQVKKNLLHSRLYFHEKKAGWLEISSRMEQSNIWISRQHDLRTCIVNGLINHVLQKKLWKWIVDIFSTFGSSLWHCFLHSVAFCWKFWLSKLWHSSFKDV